MSEWVDQARCRHADVVDRYIEIFFADDTRTAERLCRECDVRMECLEFALRNGFHEPGTGVWGGLSHKKRAVIIARRRRRGWK